MTNVLIMHCHDLGRFLGCYGASGVSTPSIDALAADGVRFDRAFCTAPQCSPSRASLFTGRYPQEHGVLGLTHEDFGWDLRPDEQHIAAVFHDNGYRTALYGVHHESRVAPDADLARRLGFDEVVTGGNAPKVAGRAVAALTDLAERAEPFYLQVGFNEPHRSPSPTDPPGTMGFLRPGITPDTSNGVTVPPYLVDDEGARAEIAELQGATRAMDAGVGEVLAALRRTGLEDDTVVVFTTDHGLALPRAKCTLYDPGIEVALVVRSPQRGWTGGRSTADLVSNIDIMPTVVEAAGIPVPGRVSGRSVVPLLNGEPHQAREQVFAQITHHDYYDPRRCVRTARHKLIVNFSSAPSIMDSSQSWRPRSQPVTVQHGIPPYHPLVELYDLERDPAELTDVADHADHAAARDHLLAQLADWMQEVDDPLSTGPVPAPLHERAVGLLHQKTVEPLDIAEERTRT
jgi:N-sulfoglucosamine sulfohydrolase